MTTPNTSTTPPSKEPAEVESLRKIIDQARQEGREDDAFEYSLEAVRKLVDMVRFLRLQIELNKQNGKKSERVNTEQLELPLALQKPTPIRVKNTPPTDDAQS